MQQLDDYLSAFRERLRRRLWLRGGAVLAVLAVGLSFLLAWQAVRAGFASGMMIGSRLLLITVLGAVAFVLLYRPLKVLSQRLAALVESRVPGFEGRIETYLGLKEQGNPFRDLLAEDALRIASANPPDKRIDRRELAWPGAIATGAILLLLWGLIAGPGFLNYGLRHLWAGWLMPGLMPPQTIAVTPGDQAVRRGGSMRVLAEMSGFSPESAEIQVRLGDKDWQGVDMVRTGRGFEFSFFSLREDAEYYVVAAGIRSPAYRIDVVDLPGVESLRLTYHYPDWTHREPETVEPGGDIQAVAGTRIELELMTDAPLPGAALVLDDEDQSLSVTERTGTGSFEIEKDGQYYLAARVGGELVRLTDDYFIRVLEDGKPEIRFTRPGRDWTASSIEEVTVNVEASDDYALESLELRYSVNGGDWQSVPLTAEGRDLSLDHVFMLEALSAGNEAGDQRLAAGDLITYYATAGDLNQSASTDMYFIQVQPFDRRYTQSQSAGGGASGGNEQQEISQRQKEIIVSTWNLIREKAEADKAETVRDNSVLLSNLQDTLADQARTLAERTRARQLSADEQIARFVENMEQAVAAMEPAADLLGVVELEQAIQPAQEALQHLLRAEAVFTDMQVSFNQGGGGGGGGRAGQDLAEMFELEMDLKKNQYETGNPASPQAQAEQADDTMRQLEELARRQEQLANNMQNRQNLTEAQRWQQEMLRREAEELKRQLDRMEQQNAMNNNQQGGQSGASGSSSPASGNAQASAEHQESEGGQSGQRSETSRRLESAIRAMNEISEALDDPARRESLERAAAEARRQLEGARDEIARNQQQGMEQSFADMASEAGRLYEDQLRMEQELQDAVRRALAERQRTGEVGSGLSDTDEARLAREKRDMTARLQNLERDINNAATQYEDSMPDAVSELEQARDSLTRTQVQERLNIAAEYIAYGAAPYIAGSESAVTQALGELRERLQRARSLSEGTELDNGDELDRTLAQTRALRRELERLGRGETAGNGEPQPGQQGEPQPGEPGNRQPGQQVGQQTGQTPGEQTGEAVAGAGWGGYDRRGMPRYDEGAWNDFGRNVDETARAIRDAIPELRNQDLSLEELNAIRDLTSQLQQQFAFSDAERNAGIIEQEYLTALNLIEQLELKLNAGVRNRDPASVRNAASEPVATEYEEAVAEYYRRLSREQD